VVNDATGQVGWAAELTHRGQPIHAALVARRALRRGRRQRNTRSRPARFANRRRRGGWLPPSLESRVSNLLTWVARLRRFAPIGALSQELVRFDTQLLQNAEISGVEYQRGELAGYEVREYVLEKGGRACAYCYRTGVPLELDHIVPRSRAGTSHRVSNLVLACRPCNQEKGGRTAEEFGHPEVQAQARLPLHDAAAVNASRWALFHRLAATGLPVELGTGGRTKWNRTVRGSAQGPLGRCGVRWGEHARAVDHRWHTTARDHRDGSAQSADVSHQRLRLLRQSAQSGECGGGTAHRGHRACRRAAAFGQGAGLCGAPGGTRQRVLQYQDE